MQTIPGPQNEWEISFHPPARLPKVGRSCIALPGVVPKKKRLKWEANFKRLIPPCLLLKILRDIKEECGVLFKVIKPELGLREGEIKVEIQVPERERREKERNSKGL